MLNPLFPYMLSLATGVPKYKVMQKDALVLAQRAFNCEAMRDYIDQIYKNACISCRYMSVPDFLAPQIELLCRRFIHSSVLFLSYPDHL